MQRDAPPPAPFLVTRLKQWPSSNPTSLNAWMCHCGAHGVTDSQPVSRHQLEAHLTTAGHRGGEYYYGCQYQRTTVVVTADADGQLTHQLA